MTSEILSENQYQLKINSFPKSHFQPLVDLIPEIERSSVFRKEIWDNRIMPIVEWEPIVQKFFRLVNELDLQIVFPWMEWQEGARLMQNRPFDLSSCDLFALCKIITVMIRNDRFCEGYLCGCFENGLVLAVLGRVRVLCCKSPDA